MEFDSNIEHLRLAYWNILMTGGPILAVALCIGLFIGVFQAATSINEATLSFVPKLVIVMGAMGLTSGYMLNRMSDYFAFIFESIAAIH